MTLLTTEPGAAVKVISADSHVYEPLDLWLRGLPAELRARGPHLAYRDGKHYLVVEGMRPRRRDGSDTTADRKRMLAHGSARPEERLRDIEADGIWAEVMYPTIGLHVFASADPTLQLACAQVYNDWAYAQFHRYFDRSMPAAMIPVLDIGAAIAELERNIERGFRAALLPAHVPSRPYNDPAYEPLWSVAAAARIPLTFHCGTGRSPTPERGPGGALFNYLYVTAGVMETVTYFVAAGVLERHPDLHIVMVESGSGWLAWLMRILDESATAHTTWVQPRLAAPPSAYIRRQVHVTFQNDPVGVHNLPFTGADCLLWGSDYPHGEGTWPESQRAIAEQFAGVPVALRNQIISGNAARLYGFRLTEAVLASQPR